MVVEVIAILVSLALIAVALIAIMNALTFPRLGKTRLGYRAEAMHVGASFHAPANAEPLTVSICIPARNEARVIAETVRALRAQTYKYVEILVLDDHSSDGTGMLARTAAEGDARVHILAGKDLPQGWGGKNWACQQLGEVARGSWLVFADADVGWKPEAVSALIAQAEATHADLLTVWPTQTTLTWGERLTVPMMAFVILGYLPALAVHHIPFASLAAANGQCLCFRREAYARLGGHAAVRDHIIEDIVFARAIKRAGLRLRTADGGGLIDCRMYSSWPEVRDGYAKNILAGYGGVFGLLLGTVFHWLILLFPWVWIGLLMIGNMPVSSVHVAWAASLIVLGIGVRALTAAVTRQRVIDALLLPLSALLFTRIAAQAVWWQVRYGGPQWKGRVIRPRKSASS